MGLSASGMGKNRHKQALAGQNAFSGAHKLIHEGSAHAGAGTVPKNGFHLNRAVLVHHGSGFSHGAFSGVQLDFNKLHFRAKYFVVDFISLASVPKRWRAHP